MKTGGVGESEEIEVNVIGLRRGFKMKLTWELMLFYHL